MEFSAWSKDKKPHKVNLASMEEALRKLANRGSDRDTTTIQNVTFQFDLTEPYEAGFNPGCGGSANTSGTHVSF